MRAAERGLIEAAADLGSNIWLSQKLYSSRVARYSLEHYSFVGRPKQSKIACVVPSKFNVMARFSDFSRGRAWQP